MTDCPQFLKNNVKLLNYFLEVIKKINTKVKVNIFIKQFPKYFLTPQRTVVPNKAMLLAVTHY